MVRTYKKKVGCRSYKNYSEKKLEAALAEIRQGESLLKISTSYNISIGTLSNKIKGLHPKKVGHPTKLTSEEEDAIIEGIITMAEWGFPVDAKTLRVIVRNFCTELRTANRFFNGKLPGRDFLYAFLNRHRKILSLRLVPNYSRKRASVTGEILNRYFDNVEKTLADVPDENKVNFDETNLSDDPGKKKCIVRKGVKYPSQVKDFTKSNISIMVAGTAKGELLPPFVCYKAKGLFNSWRNGGPKGARYTCSKSGWFDATTFEEWFFSLAFPFLKKKEGKKALIGDNLTSHFSLKVLKACKDNDIKFVCLPPNATDYLQPLDVAFFGPMKRKWREILDMYKADFPNLSAVKKDLFPQLLKRLWQEMETTASTNLKNRFERCLSRERILSERRFEVLPYSEITTTVTSVLVEVLKNKRFGEKPQMIRRKRAAVEAGKSLTNETSEEDSEEDGDSLLDEEMSVGRLSDEEQSMAEKESSEEEDEPSEKEEEENEPSEKEEEENESSEEEPEEEENKENDAGAANFSHSLESSGYESGGTGIPDDFEDIVSGKWILAEFPVGRARKPYVAKIIRSRNRNSLEVMCLRKKTKISFYFPKRRDITFISPKDVLNQLPQPTKSDTCFSFPSEFFQGIKIN